MALLVAAVFAPSLRATFRNIVSPAIALAGSGSGSGDAPMASAPGSGSGAGSGGGAGSAGLSSLANDGSGTGAPGSASSSGAGSTGAGSAGAGSSASGAASSASSAQQETVLRSYATYDVLGEYPHDRYAFTQGLYWSASTGTLFESTGLYGQTSMREVTPETGVVVRQRDDFNRRYFGEGCVPWGDKIYMLTWRERTTFELRASDFGTIKTHPMSSTRNEGWGITTDGSQFIVSDGSNVLHFWEPATLRQTRTVAVVEPSGRKVNELNELEHVKGEVLANIWYSKLIARINPANGQLIGYIDMKELHPNMSPGEDVLNGIAYDEAADVLWLTGKKWRKMFKVRLKGAAMNPPFPYADL